MHPTYHFIYAAAKGKNQKYTYKLWIQISKSKAIFLKKSYGIIFFYFYVGGDNIEGMQRTKEELKKKMKEIMC